MPLARYFVFVGGVLVALLFVVSWMWAGSEPEPQDTTAQVALDAPIASIHSTQKWPDKIEFDTSKPTIVPPPAPVVAQTAPPAAVPATAAAASPLDARAEVKPNVQPAEQRKQRVARAHRRTYPRQDYYARQDYPRQATSTWADANPVARSWSWNW